MNFYYFVLDYQNKKGEALNQTFMVPYLVFDEDEETIAAMCCMKEAERCGYSDIGCYSIRLSRPVSFREFIGGFQGDIDHPDIFELVTSVRVIKIQPSMREEIEKAFKK